MGKRDGAISVRCTACNGGRGPPSGERVDQISAAVDLLRTDPDSRRIIVSAWNVADIPRMALAPAAFFQFYVADNKLSCRSASRRGADVFLGVPFSIASYALLTHMMAAGPACRWGLRLDRRGLPHLRQPRRTGHRTAQRPPYPELVLRPRDSIFDYTYDDVEIHQLRPHPAIKAPVAVPKHRVVALIWAQSTSGVIGRDGGIPWRVPDLAASRTSPWGTPS